MNWKRYKMRRRHPNTWHWLEAYKDMATLCFPIARVIVERRVMCYPQLVSKISITTILFLWLLKRLQRIQIKFSILNNLVLCQCLGMKSFRLHACREDGAMEAQTVELAWDTISRWESDDESMAFCFQYSRNEKPARWVKVFTPYVSKCS